MATPPEAALVDSTPAPALRSAPAAPPERLSPIAVTDGELLALFVRSANGKLGDDAAFARLLGRHGGMVWGVCRRVLNHPQDAEDAFQATFLILARRARSIRASESVAGWLYRVAYRTAMTAKRRAKKRREAPLNAEPLSPETAFPDLVGRQTAAALMEELDRLPAKYRTPLVMRYLEGASRRAIADQTDATIAAVQGRLARGKKLLRSRLVRRGVSLSAAMAVVGLSAQSSEAAPARLVTETAASATALAAGGSITASAAVLSLYREGVRAMLIASIGKPAAASAGVCVLVAALATPPALFAADEGGTAPGLTLSAEVAEPEAIEQSQAKARLKGSKQEVEHRVYRVEDLLRAPTVEELEALAERLRTTVAPDQWGMIDDEERAIRVFPKNNSLVVAATEAVHEELAETLAGLRNESGAATVRERPDGPTLQLLDPNDKKAIEESFAEYVETTRRAYAMRAEEEGESDYSQPTIGELVLERDYWSSKRAATEARRELLNLRGKEFNLETPEAERLLWKVEASQNSAEWTLARGKIIELERRLKQAASDLQRADASPRRQSGEDAAFATPPTGVGGSPEGVVVRPPLAEPTPVNGTIATYWPDGSTKTEYVYRDGKVVSAVENSQEGATLYEYADDGPSEARNQPLKVAPGQMLTLDVVGALPDQPIEGEYRVEHGGTLALGAAYGRVDVVGKTIEEAERAIEAKLEEVLKDVTVQVTEGGRPPLEPSASPDRLDAQLAQMQLRLAEAERRLRERERATVDASRVQVEHLKLLLEQAAQSARTDLLKAESDVQNARAKVEAQRSNLEGTQRAVQTAEQPKTNLQAARALVENAETQLEAAARRRDRARDALQAALEHRDRALAGLRAERQPKGPVEESTSSPAAAPIPRAAVRPAAAPTPPPAVLVDAVPTPATPPPILPTVDRQPVATESLKQRLLEHKERLEHHLQEVMKVEGGMIRGSEAQEKLREAIDEVNGALGRIIIEQARVDEVRQAVATRVAALDPRLRSADTAHQYGPNSTMKQGQWNCIHRATELNPNGWATIALLRVGEHAPIKLPGDKRPRPHVRLDEVKDGVARFTIVDPGERRDGETLTSAEPGKVRDEFVRVLLYADGAIEQDGAYLILLRPASGPESAASNPESVPSIETALRLLHENRPTSVSGRGRRSSKVAAEAPRRVDPTDGKPDGKKSLGGSGHLVRFDLPEGVTRLKAIRVHGSRYGARQAPPEDFEIAFLSKDRSEILAVEHAAYGLFRRGEEKWTTVRFDNPVEVPGTFWIAIDFNPGRTKGVYFSYDTSTGGERSMTGLAQDDPSEHKPVDFGGDWMVQLLPERE